MAKAIKLSERLVRSLEPPKGPVEIWDSEQRGLLLRHYPSGRRVWVARWRDKAGGRHFERCGTWPEVSVLQAREWARVLLGRVALGLYSQPPKGGEQTKELPTVRKLWAEYEARGTGGEALNRKSIGKCHVLPAIGDMAIADVTSAHVDKLVRALSLKPRTGQACKVHLHGAMELAVTLGWRDEERKNPAARVIGYSYKPRTRVLSDAEIQRVGNALQELARERQFNLLHPELFLLLLLTGARVGEWRDATHASIDFKTKALLLEEHKTDSRGKKRVELGPRAIALLKSLPSRSENVFYGKLGAGTITSVAKPWARVLGRARVDSCTVHDLRRTFASCAYSSGMSRDDVGELLGHRGLSTTGIYTIADIKRRQELVLRAENAVADKAVLD